MSVLFKWIHELFPGFRIINTTAATQIATPSPILGVMDSPNRSVPISMAVSGSKTPRTEVFNATGIAWPLMWGLVLLKVWDMEKLAMWLKVGITLVACLLTCTSDWSCAAPLAILMIGRNRGNSPRQMLWMMLIISLYAVAFGIFHSRTYGLVHMACALAIPLLAVYNGQRGRCRWMGKFFYYYYPIHMAFIGLLARMI